MVVNLHAKKKLVSRITGKGIHRVRFHTEHLDDITDAITRGNIRSLITANTITFAPIKGTSRNRAKIKHLQKIKRGAGQGSKKGRKGAREGKKIKHIIKVRSLRNLLKVFKDRKEIKNDEFWKLYKKINGDTVRNKAHLHTLIKETITNRQS